jgi:hypothetical protein
LKEKTTDLLLVSMEQKEGALKTKETIIKLICKFLLLITIKYSIAHLILLPSIVKISDVGGSTCN